MSKRTNQFALWKQRARIRKKITLAKGDENARPLLKLTVISGGTEGPTHNPKQDRHAVKASLALVPQAST